MNAENWWGVTIFVAKKYPRGVIIWWYMPGYETARENI